MTLDQADAEAVVMRRVLGALKRRRGCIPTPEMLAELSALATSVANDELGVLGRADLRPAVVTVTVDQPPRTEAIVLGVRLGVARVTIEYRGELAVDDDLAWPERAG